jgi:hypothetical protein
MEWYKRAMSDDTDHRVVLAAVQMLKAADPERVAFILGKPVAHVETLLMDLKREGVLRARGLTTA